MSEADLELGGSPLQFLQTRNGAMLVPRADTYVARSLIDLGEFSQAEVDLWAQLVDEGDTVVDVGANFGAHTLALAELVAPTGTVLAIEPLLTMFWLLCANLALNGHYRARAFQAAAGSTPGNLMAPVIPYEVEMPHGGVSLLNVDPKKGERVPVVPIDAMRLQQCALLKIDAEGMEPDVIAGARQTILTTQCAVYFEAHDAEAEERSMRILRTLGYVGRRHDPPYYNPENFAGAADDGPRYPPELNGWYVLALPSGREFPLDPFLRAEGHDA